VSLSRKHILLIAVLVLLVAVIWKTVDIDVFYTRHFTMKIFLKEDLDKENMPDMVNKVFSSTDRGFRHSVKIDTVSFFVKEGILKHAHIKAVSKLNLEKDFFADIEIPLQVLKEGLYKFCFCTNQSAYLYLDGKELARTATVSLGEGHHGLRLIYFQASGANGITLSYSLLGSYKTYLAGQSSKYIEF